jgi:hypothetical protein
MTRALSVGLSLAAGAAGALLVSHTDTVRAADTATAASSASAGASAFLKSLPPELRAKASFPLDAPERLVWNFVPMERVGVSRTVLRVAMKTLSGIGLVQAKARLGTRVRPRSDWNLFDADVLIWHARNGFDAEFLTYLGEMRLALEPEAAALAAQLRSSSSRKVGRSF